MLEDFASIAIIANSYSWGNHSERIINAGSHVGNPWKNPADHVAADSPQYQNSCMGRQIRVSRRQIPKCLCYNLFRYEMLRNYSVQQLCGKIEIWKRL